jgi:hypothetical protein
MRMRTDANQTTNQAPHNLAQAPTHAGARAVDAGKGNNRHEELIQMVVTGGKARYILMLLQIRSMMHLV